MGENNGHAHGNGSRRSLRGPTSGSFPVLSVYSLGVSDFSPFAHGPPDKDDYKDLDLDSHVPIDRCSKAVVNENLYAHGRPSKDDYRDLDEGLQEKQPLPSSQEPAQQIKCLGADEYRKIQRRLAEIWLADSDNPPELAQFINKMDHPRIFNEKRSEYRKSNPNFVFDRDVSLLYRQSGCDLEGLCSTGWEEFQDQIHSSGQIPEGLVVVNKTIIPSVVVHNHRPEPRYSVTIYFEGTVLKYCETTK